MGMLNWRREVKTNRYSFMLCTAIQHLNITMKSCSFMNFIIPSPHVTKLSPSYSFSWAELVLFLISSKTYPPPPPRHILRQHHHISCATTTRTNSEIAGNEQKLLPNMSTKILKSQNIINI
jgi:hypothetical protein